MTRELKTIDQLVEAGVAAAGDAAPFLLQGGSGEQVTVRRNRAAFGRLGFVPRVVRDVSHVSTATELFGTTLSIPVMLSPVGPVGIFHPDGAAAAAQGAAEAGTLAFVGMSSSPAYPEVVGRAGAPQVFQIYVNGDHAWLDEVIGRVVAAGCLAVCVTVDNPVAPRRDHSIVHGLDWKLEWEGEPPNTAGLLRDKTTRAAFSWSELERLVGACPVPVVVKGLAHPDDAARAVDLGAGAVYVSNHGGRSVDHGLSTLELLPDVAAAVRGRVPVLLDGGVMHGTDVLKAIALGADGVLVGKLQLLALAAGGADGVRTALELLRKEIESTMALLGCTSLDEVTADLVRSTFAV